MWKEEEKMGDTGKWIGTLNAMERKTRTGSRRTPGPQETQESEYSPSPPSLRHVALELWIEETDMWM